MREPLNYKGNFSNLELLSGRHWYDYGFRCFRFFCTGWRARILPKRIRNWALLRANDMLSYEEYESYLNCSDGDSGSRLYFSNQESICNAAFWMLELIPPSYFSIFEDRLRRNNWDSNFAYLVNGKSAATKVANSRVTSTNSWSRICTIVDSSSTCIVAGPSVKQKLPEPFEHIEIKIVQMGSSLTGLVAVFYLAEASSNYLTEVLTKPQRPSLVNDPGRRPRAYDRRRTRIRELQHSRDGIHAIARKWLGEYCPGYFSKNSKAQPIFDFLLTNRLNPTSDLGRADENLLSALGLETFYPKYICKRMPELLTVPCVQFDGDSILQNCWTCVGNGRLILSKCGEVLQSNGFCGLNGLVHYLDDTATGFLLMQGIAKYADCQNESLFSIRDNIGKRYAQHSKKGAERLRHFIISDYIDLQSIERDIDVIFPPDRLFLLKAEWVEMDEVAAQRAKQMQSGEVVAADDIGSYCKEGFRTAIEEAQLLEHSLSAAANIGSTIVSLRVSRVALFVAAASLTVSIISLVVDIFG